MVQRRRVGGHHHRRHGWNPQKVSLFAPHFEHWITLAVLVYRALYSVFALHSYVPYTLVLIAVQVAVAHALWRLLLRVGVNAGFATGVAAIFAVLAIGWENLSTAFQITIIAPVALGFAALLFMPERGPFRRRDMVGWVLLVAALHVFRHRCDHDDRGRDRSAAASRMAGRRRCGVRARRLATRVVRHRGRERGSATPPRCRRRCRISRGSSGGGHRGAGGLTRSASPDRSSWCCWWRGWSGEPVATGARSHGRSCSRPARRGRLDRVDGSRRAGTDAGRVALRVRRRRALAAGARARAPNGLAQPVVRRFGRPAVWVCGGSVFVMCRGAGRCPQPLRLHRIPRRPGATRVLGAAPLLREDEPIINPSLFGIVAEPSAPTIARLDRQGDLRDGRHHSERRADHERVRSARCRRHRSVSRGQGRLDEGDTRSCRCRVGRRVLRRRGFRRRRRRDALDPRRDVIPDDKTGHDWNVAAQFVGRAPAGIPRPIYMQERDQEVAVSTARAGVDLRLGLPPEGSTTLCGLVPGPPPPTTG